MQEKIKQRAEELLGESWARLLWPEFQKNYMQRVNRIVKKHANIVRVYPEKEDIFRAFQLTPYHKVRVVILGQDPYHNGQADGLAFSAREKPIPRSLQNIFKELQSDLEIGVVIDDPDLSRWAVQGVFLINTSLTVKKGEAGSHSGLGWEKFVGRTIQAVSLAPIPTVFLLWGRNAHGFRHYIEETNHLVLEAPHPAAEFYAGGKAGFFGCGHFSKTNKFLKENNLQPINWK